MPTSCGNVQALAVPSGRKRLTLDLSPEAWAGWRAMGRRTGGNLTAMGNTLGLAMKAASDDDLADPFWRALADQMAAASWDRQHPDEDDE